MHDTGSGCTEAKEKDEAAAAAASQACRPGAFLFS